MRLRRVLLVVPVAVLVLAGCSAVVDGSGFTSASPSGDFPSSSGAPSGSTTSGSTPSGSASGLPIPAPSTSAPSSTPAAASDFTCPNVTFGDAALSFVCLNNSMRYSVGGAVGGGRLTTTVEPSTDWVYEIGAGRYDGEQTQPLPITTELRTALVSNDAYGTSPTVKTDSSANRTIDGKPAYLLASTITLNPSWAASRGTKVKVEKLWIVAIMTSPGSVSLWYASVPDLATSLWVQVPKVIDAIKVV